MENIGMTWMEMKYNTALVFTALNELFSEKYKSSRKNDKTIFHHDKGFEFNLHVMGNSKPWDFIVIEYSDTGEDGDAFYPKDFDSKEAMFDAMLKEIEG